MNDIFEIEAAFRPAGKLDSTNTMKVMKLQKLMEDTGKEFLDLVPPCADRTHAFRFLLDCKFWGTQAITHFKPEHNSKKTPKETTDVKEA
jgi:hypothetical protein